MSKLYHPPHSLFVAFGCRKAAFFLLNNTFYLQISAFVGLFCGKMLKYRKTGRKERAVMRILVFSDSHRHTDSCIRVIGRLIGVDMILHAGDNAADAERIREAFPDIPVSYVAGNCDFSDAPKELVLPLGGKKIFLTHGHLYNVKNDCGFSRITARAAELGCDCAVFGHTHEPFCDIKNGMTLLNPGSIRDARTYGVIEIENGVLRAAVIDA